MEPKNQNGDFSKETMKTQTPSTCGPVHLKAQVAVIGAGHAGVEAALACARMGIDTLLFTLSLDSIANMPEKRKIKSGRR